MLARVHAAATLGIEAFVVEVEVDMAGGLPAYHLVGLPATAVQEGRFRIRSALSNSGFPPRAARVTVNLAPADVRKDGAALDLPIAVGMLVAAGELPAESVQDRLFLGELSLDGALNVVRGVLPIAMFAARSGYRELVVPKANAAEAALTAGVVTRAASNLREVVEALRGERELPTGKPGSTGPAPLEAGGLDCRDVRGQAGALRALEVATAGGHNVLFIGPPGSGKTMLAQRMPSILPPMDEREALECTAIYSVAGLLHGRGPVRTRPFRAPHHTVSPAGLIGGGESVRPGEVSLAHNGVLFLDELPEFGRGCLEALRQPLEDKRLTIVRAKRSATYPAAFMLVAAMNPCPCGHAGDAERACTCSHERALRYRSRISGPLLDRFDMHLWVGSAPYRRLVAAAEGEPSSSIRARVEQARARQRVRLAEWPALHVNAQMSAPLARRFCPLDEASHDLLACYSGRCAVSARGIERLIRVARTITDLRGDDRITADDVAEAITYRYLDHPLTLELEETYADPEPARNLGA
jgi:magnesium chelatase family protein